LIGSCRIRNRRELQYGVQLDNIDIRSWLLASGVAGMEVPGTVNRGKAQSSFREGIQ
jgi:hypothetical protein